MNKIFMLALVLSMIVGCSGNTPAVEEVSVPDVTEGLAAEQTAQEDEQSAAVDASVDSIIAYVGTNIFEESLDPIKGAMSYGYSFINSALIKVDTDSEYVSDMAEKWTIDDDGLRYDFTLRPGLVFSDGSPLTAEDVVFTYETAKANQAENENVDLSRLASVSAIDELTVEFVLSEPYSPFFDLTAMLGIVPSDSYDSEAFDRYPIGSGPWKVVQHDPNQQIIVEPNQNYYEGVPAIPRVTLVYMDNDAALSAARSGQLDLVMVNPEYAHEDVQGMTVVPLETMDIRMISMPVLPLHEKDGIMVGNDVTADIAVRQALAIGIDRDAIIQNAFNGIGKPTVGFTPNLVWAKDTPVDDNRKDEAKAMLDAAGWIDADGDGVRERNGQPCVFNVYASADRYILAAALAQDAAELGIEIITHSSNWGEIADNMYTSGVLWGWGQYSPTVLYSLFSGEVALSGGWDNVVGYVNPEVDAIISRLMSEESQDAAIQGWKEVQALANADYPYLYIVNIEHCYFVSDRLDISVNTQIPHPHGHGSPVICNMKDWTIK